jgi:hypothetical protein
MILFVVFLVFIVEKVLLLPTLGHKYVFDECFEVVSGLHCCDL